MSTESEGLVLIDAEEFRKKIGLRSASRFYELAKTDPNFPKAIKRGKRFSRYVLAECDNYVRDLIRQRDAQPVAA